MRLKQLASKQQFQLLQHQFEEFRFAVQHGIAHFCSLALRMFESFSFFSRTSYFFQKDESLQYGNLQLAVISYDDRAEYNCQDRKSGAKQVSAV